MTNLPQLEPAPAVNQISVKILLVDDEIRNLDVLESILTSPDYELVRVQSAQEALMALLEGEFAVIVLDIQMPGTTGIELAQLIKQRKKTRQIPIIFLTAYYQENTDILQGYEAGAVDYLTKPLDPKILKSKIAVFVELFQKTRELAAINQTLEAEIAQRQRAEEALREANNVLEARVQERVAALADLMHQKDVQARLFDTTLSSITDLAYTFDLEGNWIYANRPLLRLWRKSLEEIVGKSSLELGYPPELAARLKAQVKEVVATQKPFRGETYFTDAAGVEDYHEYIFSPVFAADGTVTAVCGTTRLTTERKRAEAVAEGQRKVLQLIAEDAPLQQVLETLARTIERAIPRIQCAVLLLDSDGIHFRHGAGSPVPCAFIKGLETAKAGAATGGLGAAALVQRPHYVSDAAIDPRWTSHRHLAEAHGVRSWWSVPVCSSQGSVLGLVALCSGEPRLPSEEDLKAVDMATRTASIAIERKLNDAGLRESERRYSQLVESLPAAVYTTDAQGRLTLYNDAAVVLLGRRPMVGKDLWCGSFRIFNADGSPLSPDQCPMAITLREGRAVHGEEIIIERPDGSRRNVVPYPDPIWDASGRLVGTVNMFLDITDRKRAEEASRRLAAIVESSDDAIFSKDLQGNIVSWNQAAERLFGYPAEEILGQSIDVLMPLDRPKEGRDILEHVRRGGRLEQHETIRRRKDGTSVEISLTVSPIKDDKGNVCAVSIIGRNIAARKKAERELERAHKEAVAASRAKDDFLAALSHELRTPLNPVLLLASESAEDPLLPEEVRAQFARIRDNIELEERLIDDLLDITRITNGKLLLKMDAVRVHPLLNDAIATVRSELNQKRIALNVDLVAEDPAIKGDAVRLQQVFWNLLKNAVKFTPENGGIVVRTELAPGGTELCITVADTGIGMTEQELVRIFKAFAQGDHATTGGAHRFGGLGLGLAISRKLIESHAGSIQAISGGKNQGSTFTIRLPLTNEKLPEKRPAADPGSARAASGSEGISVLLVEDHEPTRITLANLLTRRRYRVKTAATVAEARALFAQEKFQILISDIGLPDGNGLELMAEFRDADGMLRGIALTGYGMEEDVARSRNVGFASHLTKPVRIQSLETALAEVIAR